jgi:hypothetical protein
VCLCGDGHVMQLSARLLRLLPEVGGDVGAPFSKDVATEALHGDPLREYARQVDAKVHRACIDRSGDRRDP